ncbi:MAG TPA: PilZ domain-containing protein [Candidatus Baltobacteraceae bacterium]|nr:PilZ domain-containing protein [Candidatus Baltobacteraceae bacterium]
MVWLARNPAPSERSNQRQSYRQSVELSIAVNVRGLPAPVYGTLINISETGCRLRSLILLDRNRIVEFELKPPGTAPLNLRGRILSRSTPSSEAGFEYGIAFEESLPKQRDALGRTIAEMQRRAAASRVAAREAEKIAAEGGSQRRSSLRTVITVPVRYRPANKPANVGEATDISAGGLRLLCPDTMPIGSEIELRFTLPSSVLKVYPAPGDRIEITPFGQRRVRVPDNRRPFEESTLHGQVLSRYEGRNGNELYGVGFTDIDGYQREEIARFIHAVQLSRLRNTY